jgi:hypothetical protein
MQMHIKQHTRGMILLTTVLILSLLAALIFSMQRAMWLYAKIHQKTDAAHQTFEALETTAFKLLDNRLNLSKTSCFSEALDVNDSLSQLKLDRGCMVVENKKKYHFWINKLQLYQKQWIIGVQSDIYPNHRMILRFSEQKGLMSWRYLTD